MPACQNIQLGKTILFALKHTMQLFWYTMQLLPNYTALIWVRFAEVYITLQFVFDFSISHRTLRRSRTQRPMCMFERNQHTFEIAIIF